MPQEATKRAFLDSVAVHLQRGGGVVVRVVRVSVAKNSRVPAIRALNPSSNMSETIICGANAEGLEALRWPNGERVPGTTAEEMANGVRQLLGLDPHPPKL